MSLLSTDQAWVGIEHRLDGNSLHPNYWPQAYVTVSLDGKETNMTPSVARLLAKHLNAKANLIDPPKPRKRS
jgi:hypothetical protein